MQKDIIFKPIGIIHSEHKKLEETPIQPVFAKGCLGQVEIFPEYQEGLKDIEGFSHLFIIYSLHKNKSEQLIVKPFLEDVDHGVFATRFPNRPNSIGLSLVKLIKHEENKLFIGDVDMLNGTPVLDIKPYNTQFEHRNNVRNGWMGKIDRETRIKRGKRNFKKCKD